MCDFKQIAKLANSFKNKAAFYLMDLYINEGKNYTWIFLVYEFSSQNLHQFGCHRNFYYI